MFSLPDFASDFFINFPSYLRKFTSKLLSYFKQQLDEDHPSGKDDIVKKTSLRDLFNEEPKDEVKPVGNIEGAVVTFNVESNKVY